MVYSSDSLAVNKQWSRNLSLPRYFSLLLSGEEDVSGTQSYIVRSNPRISIWLNVKLAFKICEIRLS